MLLLHHPAWGLNPKNHTIQEAHDAPWIGAQGLNTGPGLATPRGAPLHQCCYRLRGFVRIVANARFLVQYRPTCGPVAEYLLCNARAVLEFSLQVQEDPERPDRTVNRLPFLPAGQLVARPANRLASVLTVFRKINSKFNFRRVFRHIQIRVRCLKIILKNAKFHCAFFKIGPGF